MVKLNDSIFTLKIHHALLLIIILFTGTVAVGGAALLENHPLQNCESFTAKNKFIWLPGAVSEHFEGDRITLHFSTIQGNEFTVYGKVNSDGIYPLACEEKEESDFEVWMSDVHALQLATSTEPTETFVNLWRNGEIQLVANGEENQKKLEATDLLLKEDEPVPEWIRNIFSRYGV